MKKFNEKLSAANADFAFNLFTGNFVVVHRLSTMARATAAEVPEPPSRARISA